MFYSSSPHPHNTDTDTNFADYHHGEAMVEACSLSGFLVWLRMWMNCVTNGVLTEFEARLYQKRFHYGLSAAQVSLGYERLPSLLPESARSAPARKARLNRQTRRSLRRVIAPSRKVTCLRHLNARRLTNGQFLERICRLSVVGRVKVYGLRTQCFDETYYESREIGGSLGLSSCEPLATLKPP